MGCENGCDAMRGCPVHVISPDRVQTPISLAAAFGKPGPAFAPLLGFCACCAAHLCPPCSTDYTEWKQTQHQAPSGKERPLSVAQAQSLARVAKALLRKGTELSNVMELRAETVVAVGGAGAEDAVGGAVQTGEEETTKVHGLERTAHRV